jgi:hypothetical protein
MTRSRPRSDISYAASWSGSSAWPGIRGGHGHGRLRRARERGQSRRCWPAYTVYGPESLTLRRQAEHIGDAIGREIRLEVISAEQARAELGKTMPPIGVETILRAWAAGDRIPAWTSVIIEKITGQPAHTFAQWAADHADDFR